MLEHLGNIIEKRPWFVFLLILLITIGFSVFIPSLSFQTNFEDFAPDSKEAQANKRISDYFGMSQQIIFLIVEKEDALSTLTPQALRDQYSLQQKLSTIPQVNSTVSITTFVDTVCRMEFNKTLENCSDEQIQTATHDLLTEPSTEPIQILTTDDPNEPLDFFRSSRRGQAIDGADIKNCFLSKDTTNVTFSFEVYSLDDVSSPIRPLFPRVNLMEWYLGFENTLLPPDYDMKYQIAVRIEPSSPRWVIGNSFGNNLQQLRQHRRNHELNAYKTTAYLWLMPPGQQMYLPVPLQTGNVTFDYSTHRINIQVSKKELGGFGIAPQFGSFELPAKLTNFTAGVRYYQLPVLGLPGGHIVVNTSYLFERLERLETRPLRGALVSRMLQKYGMSWDDFSDISGMMTESGMLPATLSIKDLQTLWTTTDAAPDDGASASEFSFIPQLFADLRLNGLSFISKDYEQTRAPKASIILVQLNVTSADSDQLAEISKNIMDMITTFDAQSTSITIQATGESIVTTQINDVTMEANMIIGPMIFILIVSILFLAFRKPSYIVLPIIVFVFSSIWLFGTMALLGISFNIIAVALLPLNIGLGVEYSVNLLFNYRLELQRGRTPAEAIRLSIKEVGLAIFLAWFTTFVAFLSFLTASLPPVRDFGIFLALGITYTFIITMSLLSALRYIVDRRKKHTILSQSTQRFSMTHSMGRLAQMLMRHEKKVFLLTIILCVVMGTAVTQLKSGFSMNQFIPQDNPALKLFDQISEDFPFSSQDQEYILIEGKVATVLALQGISDTHRNMNDDLSVARKPDQSTKTESVFTIIQQAAANNQTLFTTYHIDTTTNIPATDADVQQLFDYLYESDQYGMQTQGVLHKDGGDYTATIIRVYVTLESDSQDMTADFEQLSSELTEDLSTYGDAQPTITGSLLITLSILKNMTESQIISTIVCFFLAFIMLSLIYRNPLMGLIAMIPVTISIIWVLGTMYFIGYTLNILTITVTCITIGVGIDYACYITERFRLVADKTGNTKKAVTETISRTGSAIFIAALTSMFGFGVLAFAPIPPQQQFGIITAITLIYAFITSILVLPLVLARWANWRIKKKGYIIHPGAPKTLDGITEDVEYTGEQ